MKPHHKQNSLHPLNIIRQSRSKPPPDSSSTSKTLDTPNNLTNLPPSLQSTPTNYYPSHEASLQIIKTHRNSSKGAQNLKSPRLALLPKAGNAAEARWDPGVAGRDGDAEATSIGFEGRMRRLLRRTVVYSVVQKAVLPS